MNGAHCSTRQTGAHIDSLPVEERPPSLGKRAPTTGPVAKPKTGYVPEWYRGEPRYTDTRGAWRPWLLRLLGRPDYVAMLIRAKDLRVPIKPKVAARVSIAIDEPHRSRLSAAAREVGISLDPQRGKPYLLAVGIDNFDGGAWAAAVSIADAVKEQGIRCEAHFEID
jgi:hypothetical protein